MAKATSNPMSEADKLRVGEHDMDRVLASITYPGVWLSEKQWRIAAELTALEQSPLAPPPTN
jgi:hypothetical protein